LFSGCGDGNTCTLNQSETAYCDKCDFQKSTEKCGTVTGYHGDFVLHNYGHNSLKFQKSYKCKCTLKKIIYFYPYI
jgi:hypothetical protein